MASDFLWLPVDSPGRQQQIRGPAQYPELLHEGKCLSPEKCSSNLCSSSSRFLFSAAGTVACVPQAQASRPAYPAARCQIARRTPGLAKSQAGARARGSVAAKVAVKEGTPDGRCPRPCVRIVCVPLHLCEGVALGCYCPRSVSCSTSAALPRPRTDVSRQQLGSTAICAPLGFAHSDSSPHSHQDHALLTPCLRPAVCSPS